MEPFTLLESALDSAGFFIIIAIVASISIMQTIKMIIKPLIPDKYATARKTLFLIASFCVGYFLTRFFLADSPDREKWALFVGIMNPTIYFGLTQYAVAKNKLVLLAVLKMRPLHRHDDGVVMLTKDSDDEQPGKKK